MKYYVVADIHGFYTELRKELENKGFFFEDNKKHKLVICGDLFDRGNEAKQLQDFIIELMEKDEAILIRGNHEDLIEELLWDNSLWIGDTMFYSNHRSNGTVDTLLQLTNAKRTDVLRHPDSIRQAFRETPFYSRILPAMLDYFETENHIFVHGWIPTNNYFVNRYARRHEYLSNWRSCEDDTWKIARWTNGMEAAHDGAIEPNKTIICGHWHCSFGHSKYEGNGEEFGDTADYFPYHSDGIIAIDACTAITHKINCLVIKD